MYFDHNASTPVDPRVAEAMLPWLGDRFGNPDSPHAYGRQARSALETARGQLAELLVALPEDIVFTASGSEAINTAVHHVARCASRPGHLVLTTLEHPAVRAAAARAEGEGWEVTAVQPRRDGVVAAEDLLAALRPETKLVCCMRAHNELGTLQPVAAVAERCRERGALFLCDAVQAVGKIPVDVGKLGADFVAVGAHKFGGPLGIGALWVRAGIELVPLLVGGGHEGGRRAGTPAVALAVGIGAAAEGARGELPERQRRLAGLRDRFEEGVRSLPGAVVHVSESPRLPNTSHLRFEGLAGEAVRDWLDVRGIAVSTGAACKGRPSDVLAALGLDPGQAAGSLRVSFGPRQLPEEVDLLLARLREGVGVLREGSGAI